MYYAVSNITCQPDYSFLYWLSFVYCFHDMFLLLSLFYRSVWVMPIKEYYNPIQCVYVLGVLITYLESSFSSSQRILLIKYLESSSLSSCQRILQPNPVCVCTWGTDKILWECWGSSFLPLLLPFLLLLQILSSVSNCFITEFNILQQHTTSCLIQHAHNVHFIIFAMSTIVNQPTHIYSGDGLVPYTSATGLVPSCTLHAQLQK